MGATGIGGVVGATMGAEFNDTACASATHARSGQKKPRPGGRGFDVAEYGLRQGLSILTIVGLGMPVVPP
jgi:hypothetical protein